MPNTSEDSASKRLIVELIYTSQPRVSQFLMASAAACIGFLFTQTVGVEAEWNLLWVLAAALFWGGSFFCGMRYMDSLNTSLHAQADILDLPRGAGRRAAGKDFEEAASLRLNRFAKWQRSLLLIGGGTFLCWRISEILLMAVPK
ncbi:hypothetical protein [Thalassospira xiamenensis]|uniref:hypothetical protein n=1 Tax=Thalassospira xiamenensis TaxID=220697 RepID=UPI003AA8C955